MSDGYLLPMYVTVFADERTEIRTRPADTLEAATALWFEDPASGNQVTFQVPRSAGTLAERWSVLADLLGRAYAFAVAEQERAELLDQPTLPEVTA